MTAGSYCYIGSQGIVHGTTLTLLNAARKYLNKNSLKGVVYVSSGLGGMSVNIFIKLGSSTKGRRYFRMYYSHS